MFRLVNRWLFTFQAAMWRKTSRKKCSGWRPCRKLQDERELSLLIAKVTEYYYGYGKRINYVIWNCSRTTLMHQRLLTTRDESKRILELATMVNTKWRATTARQLSRKRFPDSETAEYLLIWNNNEKLAKRNAPVDERGGTCFPDLQGASKGSRLGLNDQGLLARGVALEDCSIRVYSALRLMVRLSCRRQIPSLTITSFYLYDDSSSY